MVLSGTLKSHKMCSRAAEESSRHHKRGARCLLLVARSLRLSSIYVPSSLGLLRYEFSIKSIVPQRLGWRSSLSAGKKKCDNCHTPNFWTKPGNDILVSAPMSTSPVVCSDQQGRMLDPAHQAHLTVFFWEKKLQKETLVRKNSQSRNTDLNKIQKLTSHRRTCDFS